MRCFLYILLLLFSLSKAQSLYYSNEEGELFAIQQDSIYIRLNNRDGFDTYSLFLGKGRLIYTPIFGYTFLKLEHNIICDYIFDVREKEASSGVTTISLQRIDGSPVEFPSMVLYDINGNTIIAETANKDGRIVVNNTALSLCDGIVINSLEMCYFGQIHLLYGKEYVFRCLINYPFVLLGAKNRILLKKKHNTIELFYGHRKHFLTLCTEGEDISFLPRFRAQ